MAKIYFKRYLTLTKGQYDTLLNMISGYYPHYRESEEPLTKADLKDIKNSQELKAMFGLEVIK